MVRIAQRRKQRYTFFVFGAERFPICGQIFVTYGCHVVVSTFLIGTRKKAVDRFLDNAIEAKNPNSEKASRIKAVFDGCFAPSRMRPNMDSVTEKTSEMVAGPDADDVRKTKSELIKRNRQKKLDSKDHRDFKLRIEQRKRRKLSESLALRETDLWAMARVWDDIMVTKPTNATKNSDVVHNHNKPNGNDAVKLFFDPSVHETESPKTLIGEEYVDVDDADEGVHGTAEVINEEGYESDSAWMMSEYYQ